MSTPSPTAFSSFPPSSSGLTWSEQARLYLVGEQELKRRAAASDMNGFVEFIMRDNQTGEPIRQAAIHRSWQAHVERCKERGKFCVILAPWGHGKSEQIAIARPLFELGRNPNLRIKIVTNTPEFAQARLQTIQQYIDKSLQYRAVFPNIQPAHKEDWNKHKLVVERETYAEDGSVEAYGVFQTATGGRADLLIFDDIVDLNNAILNSAMRPKVIEVFHNVWLPRLEPGGFAIYIATRWHMEDLTSALLSNPQWSCLVQAISEDMSYIESKLIEPVAA